MKVLLLTLTILIAVALGSSLIARLARGEPPAAVSEPAHATDSLYDLETRTLEGEPAPLSAWRGKVALVVNVASRCGLTPQYAGLQALHEELSPRGFTVLAFPSNDFLGQEPGTPAEIREFCTTSFGVTFPMFEKVKVKGRERSEIYRFLTRGFKEPDWNFTKYLVDREGRVVRRFGPRTKPDDPELRRAIEDLLGG
jgi:glutathione peroxidase